MCCYINCLRRYSDKNVLHKNEIPNHYAAIGPVVRRGVEGICMFFASELLKQHVIPQKLWRVREYMTIEDENNKCSLSVGFSFIIPCPSLSLFYPTSSAQKDDDILLLNLFILTIETLRISSRTKITEKRTMRRRSSSIFVPPW